MRQFEYKMTKINSHNDRRRAFTNEALQIKERTRLSVKLDTLDTPLSRHVSIRRRTPSQRWQSARRKARVIIKIMILHEPFLIIFNFIFLQVHYFKFFSIFLCYELLCKFSTSLGINFNLQSL